MVLQWDQSSDRIDIHDLARASAIKTKTSSERPSLRSSLKPPSKSRYSKLFHQSALPRVGSLQTFDKIQHSSKLLVTRNSLILHQENLKKKSEMTLVRMEKRKTNSSEDTHPEASKLDLARDSIEILKERRSVVENVDTHYSSLNEPELNRRRFSSQINCKPRQSIIKGSRKSSILQSARLSDKSDRRPTIDESANTTLTGDIEDYMPLGPIWPGRTKFLELHMQKNFPFPEKKSSDVKCPLAKKDSVEEMAKTIDDIISFDGLELIDKVSEQSCRKLYYPAFHLRPSCQWPNTQN